MRRLAIFALAFSAAVVLSVYGLPQTVGLICAGVLALAGLAAALLRKRNGELAAIVCFGLTVGLVWTPCYHALVLSSAETLTGDAVTLRATVLEYPSQTTYGCSLTARLTDGEAACRAVLYLDAEAMELEPGDILSVTARVMTADETDSDYYRSTGAYLVAYGDSYQLMASGYSSQLRYLPARINRAVQTRIQTIFGEDVSPLVTALLTGEKSELSDGQTAAMKAAGVYHAVAVSGMHVSILMGFLGLLIRRKRRRALVGIPVVLLFLAVIGSAPGVTRAAVMQVIVLLAALLQRDYDAPTSLGAAALLMLGANPWAVQNVGFQLSFASTAGILLFSTRIYRAINSSHLVESLEKHLPFTKVTGNPLLNAVAASVSTSVGALAFSTPLMAWHYGTVSLISLLSNLLVLWAVTACFALGLAAVLLPGVLGRAVAWVCAWPGRYFLAMTGLLAKVPFASVSISSPYILAWLVLVYLVALAVLLSKGRKRVLLPLCSVVLTLCVSLLLSAVSYTATGFSFSALDVGQGQCLTLYAGGVNAMIDCGGDGNAGDTAAQFLTANGQTRLDVLVLTHFDSDHCNGVVTLLQQVSVSALYVPDVEDDAGNRQEILEAAESHGVEIVFVTEDLTLSFGDCTLQLFAPVTMASDNEACVSALFTCGDYDILVTGDMDQSAEEQLLDTQALPDIELLVVGHHGSKYATGTALLEATRPELAVISVGENSYGHPTPETLARLEEIGAEIYRTDQCGTVTVRR